MMQISSSGNNQARQAFFIWMAIVTQKKK